MDLASFSGSYKGEVLCHSALIRSADVSGQVGEASAEHVDADRQRQYETLLVLFDHLLLRRQARTCSRRSAVAPARSARGLLLVLERIWAGSQRVRELRHYLRFETSHFSNKFGKRFSYEMG